MEAKQDLEDRIKALHEEIDAIVAKHVDAAAAAVPGVPRGSVENSMLGRAHGCRCQEHKIIRKLITDAEELARKQQVDCALPAG
jgi:hypothetical protein